MSGAAHGRSLDGVRAVVTGGGRGLGRVVALGLATRGAAVSVWGRDEAADEVASEIREAGGAAASFVVDVTNEAQVGAAVDRTLGELEAIDLLVNNAAVLSIAAVTELTLDEWDRVLRTNATGVFLTSRAVARAMIATGVPGSIISISSTAGRRGYSTMAHYCASKFAVAGFSQALALELATHNITVNTICPGVIDGTRMNEQLMAAWGQSVDDFVQEQAIKRPQEPTEIVSGIVFLHRNRAITGQALGIDGGTVFG